MKKIDYKRLIIRDLTSEEQDRLDSANSKGLNPVLMVPDEGLHGDEAVEVNHAVFSGNQLMLGVVYKKDNTYTTVPAKDVKLINPKYDFEYFASLI